MRHNPFLSPFISLTLIKETNTFINRILNFLHTDCFPLFILKFVFYFKTLYFEIKEANFNFKDY